MLPLLDDHCSAARELLAPAVWDYYSAGSGEEVTAGEAEAAWRTYRLRPRVLHDVSAGRSRTSCWAARLSTPFVVAPMAFHALAHPQGSARPSRRRPGRLR